MTARLLAALAALVLTTAAARAAEPQGIEHERATTLRGTVIDLLCGVSGNCPPDCGRGRRVLGLRTAEGRLVVIAKSPTDFAGAVADLLPHCNREVELDGLMIESPAMRLYLVQAWRRSPDDPWTPANAFIPAWTARNGPTSAEPGRSYDEWYRIDPEARRILGEDGPYGIRGLSPPPAR